jgi:aryl-alcohol dehydrogenase-like predicted oxidoreductase
MKLHPFGSQPPVSVLTLGGGGIGMLWGATTDAECVATVRAAVAAGINLLDLAPRYGDGKAESIVGEAFGGRLPAGVRVTSKCLLGDSPPAEIEGRLRRSIEESLARLRLKRLDLFFLHSNVVPDDHPMRRHPNAATRMTPYSRFAEHVRPVFERLATEGLIGAWGLTGIGHPDTIIKLLGERPAPAAVQCIANLLDSPGSLKFFDGPAKPRAVIAAAKANGVGVMGIRAVQAGALTTAIDRELSPDHAEVRDYARADGFRRLSVEVGENPAVLAHRYALSIPGVDTVVLGVKNRRELVECVAAANAGPLPAELIARIDPRMLSANSRRIGSMVFAYIGGAIA